MELFEFLTQLAPILSFITIIIAIIFGVIQLKQFKTQRKDIAAVEIMRTMQDAQFTESLHVINHSEQLDSLKEVNPNLEKAIFAITTKFETLGFLVYKRVIPIEFVEQLVGGVCLALWEKLNLYVLEYRKINDQKLFLEWFEWLSYILKKRERDKAKPALEKFKNWDS
ncbi:hypothetical protein LCM02_06220 [Lutimonas saemankumensis]|uniref:DUF4760 domain-containing protein n=1 Tax=Lutimonas saemankumensis TaxID=483016 RepID=UPI001CD4905C|nr:hypothetical protein [Lutimonas saemankumensis]MCA0932039.1 hypothetical protein [Lutimonas saemankumensis]